MGTEHETCPFAKRAFNENGEVVALACDRWSCPVCSRVVAWRWAERVRFGIELSRPQDAYFWTLTLPPWVHYPKTGFRILPHLWDNFRKTMQRSVGAWGYSAFVECHPQRALIPHFHIVSLAYQPYRLKDLAVHCGFGFEDEWSQITGKRAAQYVTKYCSKQGYAMPRGFRRVRVSRDWPKLPDPVYDLKVYYPKSRESVVAYVRRVAITIDTDYNVLMSRWLDRSAG